MIFPLAERNLALFSVLCSVAVIFGCAITAKLLLDDLDMLYEEILNDLESLRVGIKVGVGLFERNPNIQSTNRESWDGMMDIQLRHSEARGIPWQSMLKQRRIQRRDLYLSDEVDTCSQSHCLIMPSLFPLCSCTPFHSDCHSRADRCPRGPPGAPGERGEPGGLVSIK
jgi:hypothetical protein